MAKISKNTYFVVGVSIPVIIAVVGCSNDLLGVLLIDYEVNPSDPKVLPGFDDADYFIKYGYGEIKDLVKQMISLLTAMLIFSVTFSEKIINFNQASIYSKLLLIISWAMMILALVFSGIGLSFNALAYPTALVDSWIVQTRRQPVSHEFYGPVMQGLFIIVISGVCFILSLIYLVGAGALSMMEEKTKSV